MNVLFVVSPTLTSARRREKQVKKMDNDDEEEDIVDEQVDGNLRK